MGPSVKNGWQIIDVTHQKTDDIEGSKYTRILWAREGKVKTTTLPGGWDYDVVVVAYGQLDA